MKYLRIVLVSVYVILVVLLLITRCSNQSAKAHAGNGQTGEESAEETIVEAPTEQAERIGGRGELKVTLLWNFPADLDLHVLAPNGCEIYFDNKNDPDTGGFLDVDDRNGGTGSAENIFWENPIDGRYEISVVYYQAVGDVPSTGKCQVVVFKGDEPPTTYDIEMMEVKQKTLVAEIKI